MICQQKDVHQFDGNTLVAEKVHMFFGVEKIGNKGKKTEFKESSGCSELHSPAKIFSFCNLIGFSTLDDLLHVQVFYTNLSKL